MSHHDLQQLLAEAPFVRALAHRLVRDDADEVVQQVYLMALESRPGPLQRPRAWLRRVVHNLVADAGRRQRRRLARERAAAVVEGVPSSHQLLELEERRRALVEAVDRLPKQQREAVLLRYFEGLPPRRIAAKLGVPVDAVWQRLHLALRQLRAQLDAQHGGDRRAWLLPLVPLGVAPGALPWRELLTGATAPTTWTGAMAMATKAKVAVTLAAVVFAAWALWQAMPAPAAPAQAGGSGAPAVASAAAAPQAAVDANPELQRQSVTAAADAPLTGRMLVHVRYADEPAAAANLDVGLGCWGGDFRTGLRHATTDADGTATFDAMAPGAFTVSVRRGDDRQSVRIGAGATAECTLQLRRGLDLAGIVVDGTGAPVAGATIEGSSPGISQLDAGPLAITAADGTFAVRGLSEQFLVGARAAGFAASRLQWIEGRPGSRAELRIELTQAGGSIDGTVVDRDGRPVGDAVVGIGEGSTEAINGFTAGAAPLPALVRTDTDGRFVAIGLPPGPQPVQVRSPQLAPWRGQCEVVADTALPLHIVLQPGVTCAGIVRDAAGEPLADVPVRAGAIRDFVQYFARSGADGTFTLPGLPPEGVELVAESEAHGKATARVAGQPGSTVACELVLSEGLVLRGRILDQNGDAIAGSSIIALDFHATGDGPRWRQRAEVTADGSFRVHDCPRDRLLAVRVLGRGMTPLERQDLDPRSDELVLRVQRDTRPPARIVGHIVDAAARPIVDLVVSVLHVDCIADTRTVSTDADGRFAIDITPGSWRLWTNGIGRGLPTLSLDDREVAPGATWDTGTLRLPAGGRLVVRGDGAGRFAYTILDARGRYCAGLQTEVLPPRSEPLLPGDYALLVRGDGIAAQRLPFAIAPGADTELAVRPAAGVRQRLEFVSAIGAELPAAIAFELRRGDEVVLRDRARGEGAGSRTVDVFLAPGEYRVAPRAHDSELHGSAAFTVGARAGDTVVIAVY